MCGGREISHGSPKLVVCAIVGTALMALTYERQDDGRFWYRDTRDADDVLGDVVGWDER